MEKRNMVPAYENRLLREHLKININYCKKVEPKSLEEAKGMLALIASSAEGLFERLEGGLYAG